MNVGQCHKTLTQWEINQQIARLLVLRGLAGGRAMRPRRRYIRPLFALSEQFPVQVASLVTDW